MDNDAIAHVSSCNVLQDCLFWSFSTNFNVTQGGQHNLEGGYRT